MIETFPGDIDQADRLKRARMRAWRRGMREMDLILGGYIDGHGDKLDPVRLSAFENLLARRDQDLYDCISGRTPGPLTGANADEMALLDEIRTNWRVLAEN